MRTKSQPKRPLDILPACLALIAQGRYPTVSLIAIPGKLPFNRAAEIITFLGEQGLIPARPTRKRGETMDDAFKREQAK
jgi:hypothetical protein